MRPIPRIALPHSIVWYKRTGVDATNKATYAKGVKISFVRCEPMKQTAMKSLGEMKDDKITLFYDCVNSSPVGLVMSLGDKVEVGIGGNSFTVRTVGDFSPHHYEVYLK
jgi:hypothetical protein